MEEKTNRIAEVIVSSVKPFQLMMGKITGIGAVGLLQFIIWGVLVIGLQMLLPLIFPGASRTNGFTGVQPAGVQVAQSAKSGMLAEVMDGLAADKHWPNFRLFCILFFRGILLILIVVCSSRQRCKRRSARCAKSYVTYNFPDHFWYCYYDESSKRPYKWLGIVWQFISAYFANSNDGAIALRSTSMATCLKLCFVDFRFCRNNLACSKNLSHRYFNVWQKSNVERNVEVGI